MRISDWSSDVCSSYLSGRKVDGDTLFNVFSVTKAVASTAVHVQAEKGLLDYDRPIADYWPEFGRNGKDDVTVRDALNHHTGTPQMPLGTTPRSEEHTSKLQSLMRISYAVFCMKNKNTRLPAHNNTTSHQQAHNKQQ